MGKTYRSEAEHHEMAALDKAANIRSLREVAEDLVTVMRHVRAGQQTVAQALLEEAVRTLDRVVEDME